MSGAYTSASSPASATAVGAYRLAVGLGLLLLAGLLLVTVLRPHWEERAYRYSEPVRAQVVALEGEPTTLGFRYIHRGQLYAGQRFRIGAQPDPARLNHRHGDWITVKIDPRHPERAVARPGFSARDRLGIVVGLVLLGAATLMFLLPATAQRGEVSE